MSIKWNWLTVREEKLDNGTIVKYQTTSNGQYNRVSFTTMGGNFSYSAKPSNVVDSTAVTAIDDPSHLIEKSA